MKTGRFSRAGAIPIAAALSMTAAIGVPLFFFGSNWVAGQLERVIRLEVEPSMSGGVLAAEFADPIGDDSGPGGYTYPLGQGLERGELDLVRYAVRKPVTRPVWGPTGAYWQLELTFAKALLAGGPGTGFRAPSVHIYIDLDGKRTGSVESAFGEGELLRFDPEHPWDYSVDAEGPTGQAELRSADSSYRAPVHATWDLGRRRLTLRIDLVGAPSLLASIVDGRPSWHYVLIGAHDPARDGAFAALRAEPNLHDGGGAKDELAPRVFDLISMPAGRQAVELSSEDAARGLPALATPMQVGGASAPALDPGRRARLLEEAALAAEKAAAVRSRAMASLPPPSAADAVIIGELFGLGLEARCLSAIESRLTSVPGDPVALAYRGALIGKSADRAFGPAAKMRLVAQAYCDLDAAAAAVAGPAGASAPGLAAARLTVLTCRGSVSSAVPNDVFGRAAQGAADLDEAAALAAASGDEAYAARCLAGAAEAFEKAGLSEDAQARWSTLASEESLAPEIALSLLDRGYLDGR